MNSKNDIIEGKLLANNQEYQYSEFPRFAAYVMQDDRLFETLTVRESITFAANLRFRGKIEKKEDRVNELLKLLQLESC